MTFEARDSAAKVVPARFKLSGTRNNTRSSSSNRRNTSGVYCISFPYMRDFHINALHYICQRPRIDWRLNCWTVSVIFAYYHCQSEKGCSAADIRYAWTTFIYVRLSFEYHMWLSYRVTTYCHEIYVQKIIWENLFIQLGMFSQNGLYDDMIMISFWFIYTHKTIWFNSIQTKSKQNTCCYNYSFM